MSTSYNILVTQGSTLLLNVTANDSNNLPINLSGYSVRGHVKYNYGDTGILFNLNPTITSYVSGTVNISGNASDLASVPVGVFPYDLEAYTSGEYVTKFLVGYINVSPECTT